MRLAAVGTLCSSSPRSRSTWSRRSLAGTSAFAIRCGTSRSSSATRRTTSLDPQLVAAVIYQESKFDADAVSEAGAVGLMQLLPGTGQGIADRTGGNYWKPDDLLNPELNIRYGSWYLRHLLDKYGDEELALAAYNAGQSNVDRWREEGVGIQFAETRHYVDRVQELKAIYARAYRSELGLS